MNRKPLLWLIGKIKKRIPGLLLMLAANMGNALLGVWFALGTRNVINAAVSGVRQELVRACWMQGAIIGGILISLVLKRLLHARLENQLDRDWKRQLLGLLLRGDYSKVSAYHSGELLNRLNNDVRILDDGLLTILPGFAAMVCRIGGAVTALLVLQPLLGLILLLCGVLLVVITGLARHWLQNLNKQVSAAEGKVSSLLQETLEKLLLVQAMDLQEQMQHRADKELDNRYNIQRKRRGVSLGANTLVSGAYYLAGFGALIWCAVGLLQGSLSFGDLTAITQLVTQLQSPFVGLSGVIPKYAAMMAAAERLMELEELESDLPEEPIIEKSAYDGVNAICAECVSFAYDRDAVLENLSFRIPKGSFAVITGPSGKGKSTLLKLLLGIFPADEGALYLETQDGKHALNRGSRKLFAYVPQGNLLFSGTIRENLLVAAPEADEEMICRAVYVSAMDDFLPQLPAGLDTVLGESGAGLSEGQAQRLAIARAILGGAPILLLDEATSALDSETEQRVLQRIASLEDRTCIAVTHRPAALELADIKLELN